jgi:hypothetical protein
LIRPKGILEEHVLVEQTLGGLGENAVEVSRSEGLKVSSIAACTIKALIFFFLFCYFNPVFSPSMEGFFQILSKVL